VAALASGCAEVVRPDLGLQQDLAQVRQDMNALTLATHRNRAESEAVLAQIDRRTREQSGESGRQVAALAARVEALGADVGRLTTRLDDVAARVEGLSRELGARRAPPPPAAPATPGPTVAAPPAVPPATAPPGAPTVTAPPGPARAPTAPPARSPVWPAPAGPAGAGPTPVTPAPASPAPAPAVPGPVARPTPAEPAISPEEAYQRAYLDFSKGNYPLAVDAFREFVRRFPDSPLADNAQYWVGESFFSLARVRGNQGEAATAREALELAVQEFRKVTLNYPRGNKVPTAIYKEALALLELQRPEVAQARLQYLLDNFPRSEEAPLARERLAALKQ
jgi:tol-pal system protein YbgF